MHFLCFLCLIGLTRSAEVVVSVGGKINEVDERFRCFNLDLSGNREFFLFNLNDKETELAKELSPAFLRVGGTGNDYVTYEIGGTKCVHDCSPATSHGPNCCLNESKWDNLANFAESAGLDMVFGLNINPKRSDGSWDPSNARNLLKHSIQNNFSPFGLELGNEQDDAMSAQEQADAFLSLQNMLVALYNGTHKMKMPKLLGPDPHSFHAKQKDPRKFKNALAFIKDFMRSTSDKGVSIHAFTHHEYIEVDDTNMFSPATLNYTRDIAVAVNQLRDKTSPDKQIWAGEIGPHNGGTAPCNHSSMRWANFEDSVWYLDALGTKAANGYSAFCRQDFIGIDYGMLDCETHDPLPDYYSALVWGNVMGTRVLATQANVSSLRAYAHCSNPKHFAAGVSYVLINLATEKADVELTLTENTNPSSLTMYEYIFTGGLLSSTVNLNGKPLLYAGKLPPVKPRVQKLHSGTNPQVSMPPQSYGFVVLEGFLADCQ